MDGRPIEFTRIINGIADNDKESLIDSIFFGRRVDFRSDPRKWSLLPKSTKESGSVILDLPVCGARVGDNTYIYGDSGYIYKRTIDGDVTNLRQVVTSHGNGMKYFGEDDYLYYTNDIGIGRYGYINSTPAFTDDFLGAEGGVPLNTHSMDFEAGSSMSADAADSASLSQTGDISIEANVKFESLPAEGSEMVIAGKWLENGDQRSYKMGVACISGFFGDGSDGALTIAADTTQAPTDSACTGTIATYALTATNVAFAAGQIVLIHQTKGVGAGTYQINTITSYTAGTIVLENALNAAYVAGAQVIVLPQYSAVTVNVTKTWTAKAWNGTVGGILGFLCNGTITVTGTITAKGKGFAGGTGNQAGVPGEQGDSADGNGTTSRSANGSGGGGGEDGDGAAAGGGGGGGHAAIGVDGQPGSRGGGVGGAVDGNTSLTDMVFGGGGGAGGRRLGGVGGGNGGNSGGAVLLFGVTIVVAGSVTASGNVGSAYGGGSDSSGGGGGGSGGPILLKGQTVTLGTGLITSAAGAGGAGKAGSNNNGGAGAVGRIHLDYITSYTGTTTPTINVTQDLELSGNTAYHLRLYISDDGADSEYYTKEIVGLVVDVWRHLAVTWDASGSLCTFYIDGSSIGTASGAMIAIDNGTALFALAADYDGASATRSFFDGLMDDVRFWGDIRTANEVKNNMEVELGGAEAGLQAYWELDNSASDTHANANNLTLRNTPTYSTDVPFSSPTTRQDIDQADASDGSTYTLAVAIDEGATHRQTFVPAKDPQKSIEVNINTIGTGDWTLTVHDALNREIAAVTVEDGDLNTSYFEFIFDSVWTPVIGASYHFHITSTVADGVVVVGTLNSLETAEYTSYYQFLVTDTEYHPIDQIINILMIGNGRYVATLEGGGSNYDPHRLTFPSTFKVRCFADWREFKAIGVWLGDSIGDYDRGYIFFWDGTSDTYNFWIPIPEGGVNAMYGSAGTLYIVAGYKGDLLEYTGGEKARKVKRLPKMTIDKQLEILPGALTMWQTLLRIGAGVTDSAVFEQGVYTWGKSNENKPDSLSYDHYISTDKTKSTGVKIGLLLPVAKKLLVGWKDNVSYGLDSIDLSSDPVPSGSLEFAIRDEGSITKEKALELIRSDFEPLVTGESIGLQYKLDRASSWSSEETESDADAKKLRVQLGGSSVKPNRHKEYQIKVNLATTVATSPKVMGVTALENVLPGEKTI